MDDAARQARAEYQREYREKNRERINEKRRAYAKAHPDKIREYQERHWKKKALEGKGAGNDVEQQTDRFFAGDA